MWVVFPTIVFGGLAGFCLYAQYTSGGYWWIGAVLFGFILENIVVGEINTQRWKVNHK